MQGEFSQTDDRKIEILNMGNRHIWPSGYRLLLILAACILCFSAHASELVGKNLRYSVNYQGAYAGELEIVIEKTDNEYVVSSISHLSLLAQVFLKSTTIESRFKDQSGTLLLVSGKETLNETGKIKRSFDVDYASGKINFSDSDPVPFSKDTIIQADSFPLGLVLSDLSSRKGKIYLSVNPKRARNYVYQKIDNETISVPAGTYNATRIFSTRPDEPERKVTMWLSDDNSQLPVKIITGKNGKETVLELLK